jgi:ribonuclease HI
MVMGRPLYLRRLHRWESFANANTDTLTAKGKQPVQPKRANSSEGPSDLSRWVAPTEGTVKANVDARWDSASKNAGIGIVLRDHLGRTILSEWKFIPRCPSAEVAEVLAILEGLKHLINLRCSAGVLESDCLRVVQVMTSKDIDISSSSSLYTEGKELLRVYQYICITNMDRVSNSVAHALAQLGKKGTSGMLCGSGSAIVSALVAIDCKHIGSTRPLAS